MASDESYLNSVFMEPMFRQEQSKSESSPDLQVMEHPPVGQQSWRDAKFVEPEFVQIGDDPDEG